MQNNAQRLYVLLVEDYKAMVCLFDRYELPEIAENNLKICADQLDSVYPLLDDLKFYEKNMAIMAECHLFIRQYSDIMKDENV